LNRLRELDREYLLYESTKQGPGVKGPQILTPVDLLDHLSPGVAAMNILPPTIPSVGANDRSPEMSGTTTDGLSWPLRDPHRSDPSGR